MTSITNKNSLAFHNSVYLCQSLVNNFLVDHTHKKIITNNRLLRKKVVDACENVYRGSLQNNINHDNRPNLPYKEQTQPQHPGHDQLQERKKIGKVRGKRLTNRLEKSQIYVSKTEQKIKQRRSSRKPLQQLQKQKLVPLKQKKERLGLIGKENLEIQQKLREQKIKKQQLINRKMKKKIDYSAIQKVIVQPAKKIQKKTLITYDYDASFLTVKANQCNQYPPHYQNIDFSVRNGYSVEKQKRNVLVNGKVFKKYLDKLKACEETQHTKNYTTFETQWNEQPPNFDFLDCIQNNLYPAKGVKLSRHSNEKKNISNKPYTLKAHHEYSKNISKTEVQHYKTTKNQLRNMNLSQFLEYKRSSIRMNTHQEQIKQKQDQHEDSSLDVRSKLVFTFEHQNKKIPKKIVVNNNSLYLNLLQDIQSEKISKQMQQSKSTQFKSTKQMTLLNNQLLKKSYH